MLILSSEDKPIDEEVGLGTAEMVRGLPATLYICGTSGGCHGMLAGRA